MFAYYPKAASRERTITQFGTEIEFTLNGSADIADVRAAYVSPACIVKGYTQVEAYVSINVVSDSVLPPPFFPLALVGALGQSAGSAGAPAPIDMISVGFAPSPNLAAPVRQYLGPQENYTFSLLQGGSQNSNVSMPTAITWSLLVGGQPANRVIRVQIDGMLVAGEGFRKLRR